MAPKPKGGGGDVIALCLAAALGGAAVRLDLPDGRFSLRWTHSIEKVEWQEDWRLTANGLEAEEARVKGSGAGMEPGENAILRDGWYAWRPATPPLARLVLARSDVVADHRLCVGGRDCRPLSHYIGGTGAVTLEPCHAP